MTSVRQGEIKGLTSLRGCAAFYVVLLHFSATAQTIAQENIPSLAPGGVLSVDLFFVLSGFIMAYAHVDDFRIHGLRAFPYFLTRRFARIEPLNAFVSLVICMIAVIGALVWGTNPLPETRMHSLGRDFLVNLTLLQGFGLGQNLNGPSWSISDECAAYLIFPVLLAVIFHRRRVVCGMTIMLAISGLAIMAAKQPHLGMDPTINSIYWDVARCCAEFALGLGCYRLYERHRFHVVFSSDRALAAIVFLISTIILLRLGDLFAALLFPSLILAITYNRGFGRRVLEHRILYFMGTISYSLYLVHDPIRPLERSLVHAIHPGSLDTLQAIGFAMLGSVSVIFPAWLSYRFIEQPGRKLFRNLLGGRELTKIVLPAMRRSNVSEPS